MLSYCDIMNEKTYPDGICVATYLIDPWDPEGNPFHDEDKKKSCETPFYEIPYRSLLPKDSENLLVCGRCLSATHVVNSSLRVMAIVAVTGQAAGIAASMCVDGTRPKDVDVALLRKKLSESGVWVSLEEFKNREE